MTGRILRHWLTVIAAFGVVQAYSATRAPEYRVKAAFVYKFATYIRWPSPSSADTTPFSIGVIGTDPFGSSLKEVVRGQTVQGRSIRIRALSRLDEALECDLVFISASEQGNLDRIFAQLRGAPVLTIADMERFAERGGMIGLITTEDNHIGFEINKGAIERAGLRASAQLLHLARIVDQPHKSGGPH
jgi:hypothetical protein